jgi:hypothetical protein
MLVASRLGLGQEGSIKFNFPEHPRLVTRLEDCGLTFLQENSCFSKTKITAEHTWGERDTMPDVHIVFAGWDFVEKTLRRDRSQCSVQVWLEHAGPNHQPIRRREFVKSQFGGFFTPTKTTGVNLSNRNVEFFDPLAYASALLPALIVELSRTRRTVMGPFRGRIELDGVLARRDGMPEKNVQTALLQFLNQELILRVRKTRRKQQDPSQQSPNFSVKKMHVSKKE